MVVRFAARMLALCLLLIFSSLAWSQAPAAKDSLPRRGDVYGGFSYLSSDSGFTSFGSDAGWNAGVEAKVYRWLSIGAEFDMGFGKVTNATSKTYTGLFGPRIFIPIAKAPKLLPFADAMFGATEVSIGSSADSRKSTSSATILFDGGADYRVFNRLSWRGQLGYLRNANITLINDEVQNVPSTPVWHLQVSTGPVYRF
jgi:hypothetical protein